MQTYRNQRKSERRPRLFRNLLLVYSLLIFSTPAFASAAVFHVPAGDVPWVDCGYQCGPGPLTAGIDAFGAVTLHNTIVALNTHHSPNGLFASDCSGPLNSLGTGGGANLESAYQYAVRVGIFGPSKEKNSRDHME